VTHAQVRASQSIGRQSGLQAYYVFAVKFEPAAMLILALPSAAPPFPKSSFDTLRRSFDTRADDATRHHHRGISKRHLPSGSATHCACSTLYLDHASDLS